MCAKPLSADAGFLQAETLPLFHREVRERLSPTALELILRRAEIFVEGGTATGSSAGGTFLGSAMLTLDLAAMADRLRSPLDGDLASRLCTAIEKDAKARHLIVARALEVARSRLAAPSSLRTGALRMRSAGAKVFVDLELEGTP